MEFLRECARRLDTGESSEKVMHDLRQRYTTLRCVNVKSCLVRKLCALSPVYEAACAELLRRADLDEEMRSEVRAYIECGTRCTREESIALVRALPPRMPENVRRFALSREESRACRRLGAQRAVEKNKVMKRVPGRTLLAHARCILDECGVSCKPLSELVFALLLVTGRRECELLNGRSSLTLEGASPYALTFGGQAKKRRGAPATSYTIPTLAPAADVVRGLRALRSAQNKGVMMEERQSRDNAATSRCYQSYLSRHLSSTPPWNACPHVHALRGIYACIATRLFDWGDHSDAYVVMSILGHAGMTESLVYTPFRLGDDFGDEPRLGLGTPL